MRQNRDPAWVILTLSVAALVTALVAQYGFSLQPCQLCLYQRVPYAVAILLAGVSLTRSSRAAGLMLAFCALSFLGNAGLALFHVGVEQHWWEGLASCHVGKGAAPSVEDLMAALAKPVKLASCDAIAWSLFGVSMAGYNLLASIGLAGFAALAARRIGGNFA